MGEYARFSGHDIKIGTCEDMYYLRADQRRMVEWISGNVNVNSSDVYGIRFRFPWPDEDHLQPGSFDDYDRSVAVWGMTPPDGVDHSSVQFTGNGYLVSLPCPESKADQKGLHIHRNGFGGAVHLVRQKLLPDGRLVPIMKCGGCGAMWRMEGPEEIQALADWFLAEGEKKRKDAWTDDGELVGHKFWHEIAKRILAGARMMLDSPKS